MLVTHQQPAHRNRKPKRQRLRRYWGNCLETNNRSAELVEAKFARMTFWAYMLCCSDDKFYVGHTDNLDIRISQHQSGTIPGYTHKRRPVALVWSEDFGTRLEAKEAEHRLKGWSRPKKQALIDGDWDLVQLLSRNWQDEVVNRPSTGSGLRELETATPTKNRSAEPVEARLKEKNQ